MRTVRYSVRIEGQRLTFLERPDLYGYHLVKQDGRWIVWAPSYSAEEQAIYRARLWRRFWDREADLEVIVRPFEPQSHTEKE